MLAQRPRMGLQQLVSPGKLFRGCGVGDRTGTLVIRVRDFRVDRDAFVSRQMDHHIRPLGGVVPCLDHDLRVEIDMFEKTGGFHNVAQLRLSPGSANLVVPQRRRQRAGLLVKPRLLVAQALELLTKRTHLTLAPFFDIRHFPLEGVEVLLYGSEGGQHLALFGQGLRLFLPFAFLFGLGFLALVLDANLLGLLGLRQLGFHELQLLLQPISLRPELRHLCRELADSRTRGLRLAASRIQLLPVGPASVTLSSASAQRKTRHDPQNRDDDDQRQYLNHIFEHMF